MKVLPKKGKSGVGAGGDSPGSGDKKKKKDDQGGRQEELLPWVAKLSTDELLTRLIESKKGRFGDPLKKLEKDMTKRLGVSGDEAFTRGGLLAYSRLPKVSRKLEKLHEERLIKAGKKDEKIQPKKAVKREGGVEKAAGRPKDEKEKAGDRVPGGLEARKSAPLKKTVGVLPRIKGPDRAAGEPIVRIKKSPVGADTIMGRIPQKPSESLAPLPSQGIPDSQISKRLKSIEEAMGDQRRLESLEATKKKKKGRSLGAVKKPFIAVRNAINSAFSKVSHAIFVFFSTIMSIPLVLARIISRMIGGFLQSIYKRVGGVSPFGWKKKITQLVIYSGTNRTQEQITGMTIVNGAILAALLFLADYFLLQMDIIFSVVISVLAFGAVWVVVYSILNLMADKRADEVEGALPDVLQIVSANISAGMTPYNSLWVSARKEFGALAEEIKIAQKETLGGKAFTSSLTDMGSRVRSNVLQRTMRLLIQGMKAGGELPNILQGIGADIREMRLLQKEMAANTMSYVLFILFGMMIGAPLLFSVSIQFVDIVNKFQPDALNQEDIAAAQNGPGMSNMQGFDMMSLGSSSCPKDFDGDGIPDKDESAMGLDPKNSSDANTIDPDTKKTYYETYSATAEPISAACITPGYLSTFAMMALSSIAFFGSLLVGLIRNGKQSAGLKLLPLLLFGTLAMFWVMKTGMAVFFGSMFG